MKTAIITGAESGIGAAVAERFRAAGIKVYSLDLASGADFQVDISQSDQVNAAVDHIGSVDILINSAGITGPNTPLADVSDADWNRTIAINLNGTFNTCRAVVPGMVEKGWGRIVNIASIAGKEGNPNLSAYSASKAAVNQLMRVAALEWGADNIRINALHPNMVFDTALWTQEILESRARNYGLSVEAYRTNNLLKVEVHSRDVAELAAELCGPLFAKTTGAQVPVDGGNERVV